MAAPLDIDLLKTFAAIAESGSFTRAAAEVHKTQSAVSMQMKKLEERLGRPVFERNGRAVRLTPDGRRLLEYAQRMLRLNDEVLLSFTEPDIAGEVTLGVPDDYADRLLPRVLSAFARTHPHVELIVHCHGSSLLTGLIQKGGLDLAIVTHGDCSPMGEVVRREPLHWVGGPDHATHLADPLPLAVGPQSCCWRQMASQALDEANRRHRIAYTSSSAAALTSAVIAGLAVSVLPESAIRPEMRILSEKEGFPPLPLCEIAFIRARHAITAMHDALVEHIVTRIGNLPSATPALEAAE